MDSDLHQHMFICNLNCLIFGILEQYNEALHICFSVQFWLSSLRWFFTSFSKISFEKICLMWSKGASARLVRNTVFHRKKTTRGIRDNVMFRKWFWDVRYQCCGSRPFARSRFRYPLPWHVILLLFWIPVPRNCVKNLTFLQNRVFHYICAMYWLGV